MAKMSEDLTNEEASALRTAQLVDHWRKAVKKARNREKSFLKEGKNCVSLYEAEEQKENSFNILFSNTETMLPALYNNTPRPDTRRKFNDADPMGKAASEVVNRILTYALDTGSVEQPSFDETITKAVLSALVPGRGLVRVNYNAVFEKYEDEGQEMERVVQETVTPQLVRWDRVVFGYAESWEELPWMAFEHFMSKAELEENFGAEKAAQLTLTVQDDDGDGDGSNPDGTDGSGSDSDNIPSLEHVWEIWDRKTKTVYFMADSLKDDFVKSVSDPLNLSAFYPVVKPLIFIDKLRGLTPVPLYRIYKNQAEELNRVGARISRITAAIKVRGAYFGSTDLTNVLKAQDNEMVPVQDIGATGDVRSMDAMIWFYPVDKLVGVLQQLTIRQTEIKNTIYEITGISDILRGESAASESATAQNIKNQWGSLRLKKSQKRVQSFIRDILRLVAEMSIKHLQQDTIQKLTELPYVTQEQATQAHQIVNAFQLQQQQEQQEQQAAQQAAQQVPPGLAAPQAAPGQPPAPPPQQVQQAMSQLQQPVWESILQMLKDGLARSFHIDIETNSTVDVEATEDKQNIAEFMNAMAQFMNGITPLVENGSLSFDAAKVMLMALVRRYRFGVEVETEIEKMQAPKPPQQPGQAADQANAQLIQAKVKSIMQGMQQAQEVHQAKMQQMAQDAQFAAQTQQAKLAKMQET